jgi:hypothetical protein
VDCRDLLSVPLPTGLVYQRITKHPKLNEAACLAENVCYELYKVVCQMTLILRAEGIQESLVCIHLGSILEDTLLCQVDRSGLGGVSSCQTTMVAFGRVGWTIMILGMLI